MIIAFCNQALNTGHESRGIGTYAKNLYKEMKKNRDIEIIQFSSKSEKIVADIIFYPFFDFFTNSLPLRKSIPTFVTIHDLIPLRFKKYYPPGIKGSISNFFQKLSLRNINGVITDSNSSKEDIEKILGVNEEKIRVIHLGVDGEFKKLPDRKRLDLVKDKYNLPREFVIYTGGVNWNKNLLAVAGPATELGFDVVFVGGDFELFENLEHTELKTYKEFIGKYKNNSKVHLLGYLPKEDLVAVLNQAKVLLMPSFYEGFGLPILEAQACGVPVITSKTSSLPEVAGDGAMLVDPYNQEEIKRVLLDVWTDDSLRGKLIKSGYENVKRFSWDKTAKETIEFFKETIKINA